MICDNCQYRPYKDTDISSCENCKPTNGDKLRAMTDEELAEWLNKIAYQREAPWSHPFHVKFCVPCPRVKCLDSFGVECEYSECDFADGVCPHGDDIVWWLREDNNAI